jgi:alpha-methylacyl-CoA racemase
MTGPLDGLRVVEMAGIGPGPHAAMMLADLGADVVRVDREGVSNVSGLNHTLRSRRIVCANLKNEAQRDRVRELIIAADVLVEGFRPGVMERLGLGPSTFVDSNPGLVYARMTGWGQDGPWATTAGHDINYISVTGVLEAIGPAEHPVPPLNLVGDYGGGSMLVVTGVMAALVERARSGLGQVVDAAMVNGVSVLLQPVLEMRTFEQWSDDRAANVLDGAAPYYRTYVCADGRHVAVGCIEPQFYLIMITALGLRLDELPDRDNRRDWPRLAQLLSEVFASRTRDDWASLFDGTDACVTPVLSFDEAADHHHMSARAALIRGTDGVTARGPATRFSRSVTQRNPTGLHVEIEDVRSSWTIPSSASEVISVDH